MVKSSGFLVLEAKETFFHSLLLTSSCYSHHSIDFNFYSPNFSTKAIRSYAEMQPLNSLSRC